MAKVTCDDLRHGYLEDFVVIGSWLSGYYNAKRNNTIVDRKQLGINTQRALQFCQINPQVRSRGSLIRSLLRGTDRRVNVGKRDGR